MLTVGFDTSNYTTSEAIYDGKQVVNASLLLNVRPGELGLRQSDALFSHVKNLPAVAEKIGNTLEGRKIHGVGVSTRPRNVEGSYMPCFLAGVSSARVLSQALGVPCYEFSHQEGHIAAVLQSACREDLLQRPFLAWHLSGGTTELLHVTPREGRFFCEKIGGTTDISAGQMIDRTGKALNLQFPSGRQLDVLSKNSNLRTAYKLKLTGLDFSLSGLENKMQDFLNSGASSEDTARYVLNSLCGLILRCTREAFLRYPGCPVMFSGGVASNSMLRDTMSDLDCVFGAPDRSTDNAAGIAVLTYWAMNHE